MSAETPTEFQLRQISYYLRERPNDPALKGYLENLGFDGDIWDQLQDSNTRQNAINAITENISRIIYDAIKLDDAVRVVDLYDAAKSIYKSEYDILKMSLGEGGILKGSPKTFNAISALVDSEDLHEFIFELFDEAHEDTSLNLSTILNTLKLAEYPRLNEIAQKVVEDELDDFLHLRDDYLFDLLRPENLDVLISSGVNLEHVREELEKFYLKHYTDEDGVEYEQAKSNLFDLIQSLP